MFSGVFRTFGGSFSAVWTATIARVGAFCSVFQTVQDSPAKSEEFCKPSHQFSKFRQNFAKFAKFCKFSLNTAFLGANFIDFFFCAAMLQRSRGKRENIRKLKMKTPSYFGERGKISPISTMSCSILAVVSLLEKADLRRCICPQFLCGF